MNFAEVIKQGLLSNGIFVIAASGLMMLPDEATTARAVYSGVLSLALAGTLMAARLAQQTSRTLTFFSVVFAILCAAPFGCLSAHA